MIKNVFLDLDDTLLDFQKAERIAISKAFNKLNIVYDDKLIERYIQINLHCWKALERGEMSRDEVLIGRFKILFSELKINVSATLAQNAYEEFLSREHDFLPEAKELLAEFEKTNKYDLYIATNGIPEVQKPRIRDAKIAPYFKKIFISEEIGYAKPDGRFFEKCFCLIPNFKKEETIIVGDSLSSDIQGGINAGILTCHFNPKNQPYNNIKPDYTINNLSKLPELLDSTK